LKQKNTFPPPTLLRPGADTQVAPCPRVVIVGAGFGGLSAAQALADTPVNITIVDRRNFHLFQPLLYQVATAGLNPSDIAWPIRGILSRQTNARVVLGEVCGVDTQSNAVLLANGQRLSYHWLILATGATHNYFGNDQWGSVALGLKRTDDATLIRRRILLAFERAEVAGSEIERRKLMPFNSSTRGYCLLRSSGNQVRGMNSGASISISSGARGFQRRRCPPSHDATFNSQ